MNMSDWFTTTADNYLSRLNRQAIEQAVTEAAGEQKAMAVKAASKKTEAVSIAARLLEGTNWIPASVHISPAVLTAACEDEPLQDDQDYQFPEAAE